MNFKNYSD